MTEPEKALLEEIAQTIEYWSRTATSEALNASPSFSWALRQDSLKSIAIMARDHGLEKELADFVYEFLYGFAHSLLTSFDGGSKLSDRFPMNITTDTGDRLCKYLHELLPDIRFERESKTNN